MDSANNLDFPPYAIHSAFGNIGAKTMSPSGTQYGNVTVYDAHNIYGLTEQIATNQALRDIRQKRPFILSRSSFLGTGKHSAKWTGDNGEIAFNSVWKVKRAGGNVVQDLIWIAGLRVINCDKYYLNSL